LFGGVHDAPPQALKHAREIWAAAVRTRTGLTARSAERTYVDTA
jgi:hypothetical protein